MFVVITLLFREQVEPFFADLRAGLLQNLDWFFLASGNIFVIVCVGLIFTPLGRVRIGGTEATPDYSYAGWLAMLFAAGMGIGLVFFGVSEPMSHFSSAIGGVSVENGVRTDWAPLGGAEGDATAASALGMAATIYHWHFIRGQYTRSWLLDWLSFHLTKVCHSPCAQFFTLCLVSVYGVGLVILSIFLQW